MNQFTLFLSVRSPFARRIRIALKNLDLPHVLEVVDVFQYNPNLINANPLGLVPTLITPDGKTITDSSTILEYLHDLTGRIWPREFHERTEVRQASTWCAGIMQNCVSYFLETRFHAVPEAAWAQEYADNILATLAHLEKAPEKVWSHGGCLTQAAFDLGTALEYLQLRLSHLNAQEKFPKLYRVLEKCRELKAFAETAPPAA